MNHAAKTNQQGFTLIELMLAMTFISVLLLAIAMTIIQIGSMYNRGMTLKETNQAAVAITTDIQRSILTSEAFSITDDYIVDATNGNGRVCLGTYTYLWNLGRTPATAQIKYLKPSKASQRVNLVKISDPSKAYCRKDVSNNLVQRHITVADTDANKDKEMLAAGDHSLVIYKFALSSDIATASDTLTGQQVYLLDFSISTGNLAAIDAATGTCLAPTVANSDITYCSVQDFSLVVRAGNRFN